MKEIKSIKPVGTQILIEVLTSKEILGTILSVTGEGQHEGPPQAVILDIGARVNLDDWGFKKGDRVVLSGTYTPFPKVPSSKSERTMGVVEPHMIKAILVD